MKTKLIPLLVLFLISPVLYNNCSESQIAASKKLQTNASNQINVVTTNQAPKINCDLENATGTVYKSLSTVAANDIEYSDPNDATPVVFDCSGTVDEDAVGSLVFDIDTDYDPNSPSWSPLSNQLAAFQPTLRRPMAIRATDSAGASTIKVFNLEVDCANSAAPNISAANVTVAATAKKNFFNYSVSGVTDATALQYAWDFNGDKDFDPTTLNSYNIWTNQASLNNVYAIYGTSRQITVRAKNACGIEVDINRTVSIDVSNVPHNAPADIRPYWYIQGQISGSHPTAQRSNGDVLVTMYPEDRGDDRMDCDYRRNGSTAVFSISGFNRYQDAISYISSESPYNHGLSLNVINVPDSGAAGSASYTQANGISVSDAQYGASVVDETPDQNLLNERFVKNGSCSITLNRVRAISTTPCASGPAATQEAIQIYGEYSCPTLNSTTSQRSVAVANGKYFCEVAVGNGCVGGGQGQGGAPPMPE